MDWKEKALCSGISPSRLQDPETGEKIDPFFQDYESHAETVDEMCIEHCPVQKECFWFGVNNKEQGLWGGVYLTPSGKIDEYKNRHKTQEQWDKIEENVDR